MSARVSKIVEALIAPLEEDGFELWNVEYAKEGKEKQLRVFVDKIGGISIDDCETVSRYLSEKLDEADPISEPYDLIVSSPGMDRPLLRDEHYGRYAGHPVEISLYKGFEGRKRFVAILGERTKERLCVTPIGRDTLKPEGEEIAIPLELVSKVNLMVIF
jgi:ribosome maturation factor RimP